MHCVVNRVLRVYDAVFENPPPNSVETPISDREKTNLFALPLVFSEERPQTIKIQVGKSKRRRKLTVRQYEILQKCSDMLSASEDAFRFFFAVGTFRGGLHTLPYFSLEITDSIVLWVDISCAQDPSLSTNVSCFRKSIFELALLPRTKRLPKAE